MRYLVHWQTEDRTPPSLRKERYTEEAKQAFRGGVYVPDDLDVIDLAVRR